MNPMSLLTMSPEMLREASHRQSEHSAAARLAHKRRMTSLFLWTASTASVISAFLLHIVKR